jgi:hypothetical protein
MERDDGDGSSRQPESPQRAVRGEKRKDGRGLGEGRRRVFNESWWATTSRCRWRWRRPGERSARREAKARRVARANRAGTVQGCTFFRARGAGLHGKARGHDVEVDASCSAAFELCWTNAMLAKTVGGESSAQCLLGWIVLLTARHVYVHSLGRLPQAYSRFYRNGLEALITPASQVTRPRVPEVVRPETSKGFRLC